ncbi:EpsG family protein [Salinivibrio sp. YCSC6]|uniref:EpsG family protein n=1 Tax=Salinivibrio sp. YCSC6 TaxID=2003370 RepID=UPI000BBC4D58|nr:EpsG family protein [Salinivibrio sp. YCSC6]PCE67628.1 hypothetical protein B6G00_04590 [Salinivibrio sp. YCSC6]QCF35471.1 EpsG family protein [Salinivibrio sp. YCSC6]
MLIYYLTIFFLLFTGVFYERTREKDKPKIIVFVTTLLVLVYGFRYQVGVDWFNYINVYNRNILYGNIYEFTTIEVGYKLLNIIAYYIGEGIITVILLSTILFFYFTFKPVQKLDLNPFYFLAIVAPYHLVMSGMNYTRQAVALSLFLYALSFLINKQKIKFLIAIFVAGSFHISALCFIPLLFIDGKKRYIFIPLIVTSPLIINIMLNYYSQYVESSMDSAGLYLRALYLIVPTFLFSLYYKGWHKLDLLERRLVYLVLISFPLIISFSYISSTIADRFSYYFILMGTFCWMLFSKKGEPKRKRDLKYFGNAILLCSSSLAFVVWTLYSGYISSYQFDSYFSYWLEFL